MHRRYTNIKPGDILMLCVLVSVCVAAATYQELHAQTPPKPTQKHSYKIDLKIDFDRLTYTGVERVRWVNRGEKPSSIIYFHLYPNLRTAETAQTNGAATDA